MPRIQFFATETRRAWTLFALIVAVLLAVRVPVMFREPGEMDEECYALPGLFILRDGVPKLPTIPGRSNDSIFYHADEFLFAEPPLYFYLQALFYSILPPVYGTARMLSMTAGIVLLGLMWTISRRWLGGIVSAVWTVGLYANSRWFFLQAIRARPDLLCSTFGVATIWAILHWRDSRKLSWLCIGGIFIGLGGMTHPFALVYAIPIAVWVMLESSGWNRLIHPALLTGMSLLVACLWLPLILQAPEIFVTQFRNQFLSSDEPLAARLFTPWHSWWFHAGIMLDQIKTWQYSLAVFPLIFFTIYGWRSGVREARIITSIAWSSLLLIALMVGTHHPIAGYFTFASSLMFLCTGWLIQKLSAMMPRDRTLFRCIKWSAAIVLGLSLIPISRLGTLLAHIRNWDNINYNAPAFARQIMADIPKDALCAVDSEFLLDFVAAGRPTVLARDEKYTLRANSLPIEYIVGSRMAIGNKIYNQVPGSFLRRYGDLEDLYACYAEVYLPTQAVKK